MIAKLTKEAAEEADQKSFCDEEISESKAKQADLTGKLDKTSARIAKADADKAKLLEEIKTLEAEVAKAIGVLSDYYNSAGFVQLSSKEAPEFGGAKGDVGSTIVSILEVAESDFTTLLAEAEADESAQAEAYEKLTQDNTMTKTTKLGDAKGKKNEVK